MTNCGMVSVTKKDRAEMAYFTPERDARLIEMFKTTQMTFMTMAKAMGGGCTKNMCIGRMYRINKDRDLLRLARHSRPPEPPRSNPVPYSAREDEILTSAKGRGLSWPEIAALMPGRTAKMAKGRWQRLNETGREEKAREWASRQAALASARAAKAVIAKAEKDAKLAAQALKAKKPAPPRQSRPTPKPMRAPPMVIPALEARFVPPDPSGGVRLMDLEFASCRWPLGDPRDDAFRFCGGGAEIGSSYCRDHRIISVTPSYRRGAAAAA